MKKLKIGGVLNAPAVAVGCMRISSLNSKELQAFISSALELGMNFFDHADIYGGGECERVFADAVRSLGIGRDKIILQSKCGIRNGMYDFSAEHIISSTEGILRRLGTDHLDILLLHRPDALMEPEEVAEAFDKLEESGKAAHFGVSNMNPMQIKLLQKTVKQKLIADQIQFSPAHAAAVSEGFEVNMMTDGAVCRSGGILEYCRMEDMTPQAWSPLQYGFFGGTYLGCDKYPELNRTLEELGEKYGAEPSAIAVAWINRHPAKIQTVSGTANSSHLAALAAGADITLTREEWYKIYTSAGNILP